MMATDDIMAAMRRDDDYDAEPPADWLDDDGPAEEADEAPDDLWAADGEVREQPARQIRNWLAVEVPDDDDAEEANDDGDKKKKRKPVYVPMPMADVLRTIRTATGDWPRRVGQWLFAHEGESVAWLESTAATFGYLQSRTGIVPWKKGTGYVSQEQVNAELARTATAYEAIERFPHWPAMQGHYYACTTPRPGNGKALAALLDRFSPATDVDRDLMEAMFVTPGLGVPGGCRPAFLVTSTSGGRGSGKSTLIAMVGHLWDGFLDFHAGEDVAQMKQRMLSPDGLAARVATLDNIKSLRFSWAELESLITIPKISGKRMYVGEGSRPNTLTWLLTLNGASLSKDMAQRVVIIEIDKPKRVGTWLDDTIGYIAANRAALLADVAAFYRRQQHPPHQFTRWATWEREVLSRLAEPEDAQRIIVDRQGTVDAEGEEAALLREYFAERIGDAGYQAEQVWVHIPSAIAGQWYNAALNEHHKIPGAARLVKQLCEEGSIAWLTLNASRAHGRGFVWIGAESAPDSATRYDLEARLASRRNGNY